MAKEVTAELRGRWYCDLPTIEGLAATAHQRAELGVPFPPAHLLAHRLGFDVLFKARSLCGQASLFGDVLWVAPSADIHRQELRIFHELAHALLTRERPHAHPDVWGLTLALALPPGALGKAREQRRVPRWAVGLRLEMSLAAKEGRE